MKKKLLSLVLAGAMVASTSISAFAAVPNVTGPDNTQPTTNVDITGKVLNNSGQEPVGTFNVTVPTATSFTVKADGTFVAPEAIVISNNGPQNIDVYADSFVDSTKGDGNGITVKSEEAVKTKDRTFVSLKISGLNTAYLKTEDDGATENGIYKNKELTSNAQDGILLMNIGSGRDGSLRLDGTAGKTGNDQLPDNIKNNGLTDKFTLTLKIKKSEKQ